MMPPRMMKFHCNLDSREVESIAAYVACFIFFRAKPPIQVPVGIVGTMGDLAMVAKDLIWKLFLE